MPSAVEQRSAISPLAGHPAPKEMLVDVWRLEREYYARRPDLDDPSQLVSFGTSGHRGSSLEGKFTEAHIQAITQAICDYRGTQRTDGPIYVGKDTHALSGPAQNTILEVLAANEVNTIIQQDDGVTPTPVISWAILVYNYRRREHLADGIGLTPPDVVRRIVLHSTRHAVAVGPGRQQDRAEGLEDRTDGSVAVLEQQEAVPAAAIAVVLDQIQEVARVVLRVALGVRLDVERDVNTVRGHHVHQARNHFVDVAVGPPPAHIDRAGAGLGNPLRVPFHDDGRSRIVESKRG